MFKELKENMKKVKKMKYEQIVNMNEELENLKRDQKEILEIKNSIERFKVRFEKAEERISGRR